MRLKTTLSLRLPAEALAQEGEAKLRGNPVIKASFTRLLRRCAPRNDSILKYLK